MLFGRCRISCRFLVSGTGGDCPSLPLKQEVMAGSACSGSDKNLL